MASRQHFRFGRLIVLISILAVFAFLFLEKEESALDENEGSKIKESRDSTGPQYCSALCEARQNQLITHHGGDLLDTTYLVKAAQKERDNFHQKLKVHYDKVFRNMWVDKKTKQVVGNRAIFSANENSDLSYRKFKRKLQMKVLRVQIALMDEKKNLNGCDCTEKSTSSMSNRSRRRLSSEKEVLLPEVAATLEQFIWSTGGHSASASHGNLFNESYTSYLEQGAKDAFRSVGIDFIGRNYAMGGMDSAPQLALCNEAVYGADADIISWDFGMTDGRAYWKTHLYASRIGVHRNRPAHVSINIGGRTMKPRLEALGRAEANGVPSLYLKPSIQDQVTEGVPDVFGMSTDDVMKIGPYARYYKCKDTIEKEEPCGKQKWNSEICPNRKFKTSWHPGWRVHARDGFLMALAMIETLIESLKELEGKFVNNKTAREIYDELKAEEDSEYAAFANSKVVDEYPDFISEQLTKDGLTTDIFFKNKAMCTTSLLPAQTRYLGILTESEKKGEFSGFDTGIELESAKQGAGIQEKDKGSMTLVYDIKEYQQGCDVELNVDHKDFFFASDQYGWTSIEFPNNSEMKTYAPSEGEFNPDGVVILCLLKCDWGKCPPGDMREENFNDGTLKLELNGEAVTAMVPLDQCSVLKTKEGIFHKPKKDTGKYELRVWMDKTKTGRQSFIRITSLIVL